jgi:hypothetical protein
MNMIKHSKSIVWSTGKDIQNFQHQNFKDYLPKNLNSEHFAVKYIYMLVNM